jgi:hypothetical protein
MHHGGLDRRRGHAGCRHACRCRPAAPAGVLMALLLACCLGGSGPLQPACALVAAVAGGSAGGGQAQQGEARVSAQPAPTAPLLLGSVLAGIAAHGAEAGPDWPLEHAEQHMREHVQHSHTAAVAAAMVPVPNRFSVRAAGGASGRPPCGRDRAMDSVLSQ